MARIIELPVSYIVFNTGYTGRVASEEYKRKLIDAINMKGMAVVPLFIHDVFCNNVTSLIDNSEVMGVKLVGGVVNLTDNLEEKGTELMKSLNQTMGRAVNIGTITFRASKYDDIFPLYNILRCDVDYCSMYGIIDIIYAEVDFEGNLVKVALVNVDAESG